MITDWFASGAQTACDDRWLAVVELISVQSWEPVSSLSRSFHVGWHWSVFRWHWIFASSGTNCSSVDWAAASSLPTTQCRRVGGPSLQLRTGACFDSCPFPLVTGHCARCGENVVGEGTGCTAMDQVFHVECFTCMMCNNKLRGQPFYAVEKKAYCEPCYIVSIHWF